MLDTNLSGAASAGGMAGQASVELIVLVGVFLLVIIVFAVLSTNILFNVGTQKNINAARDSVQKLAQAADSVYSQGEGATTSVTVDIPANAALTGGKSFIGRPSGASGNASSGIINLNVGGSDEYALTTAPLSGAFPNSSGSYQLQVTSHGSYVTIGSGIIDVSPGAVFVEGSAGVAATFPINITLLSGQPVNISISSSPQYANVGLAPNETGFITSSNTSVTLKFNSTASAAGIYDWELQLNASSCAGGSCPADYITIPVSLEVGEG